MIMTEVNILGWADYLVIAIMLCISAGIGLYYRFSGGHQKTTEEYFIASRTMGVVPVAIALVVASVSPVSILGMASDIYTYGSQFFVIILAYILGFPLVCYGFLPVFYKLQATSAYEYLEKRFGVRTRLLASFAYWLQIILYAGVVLYGPSLALEATTGLSKTASVIIIGVVCAFYSCIGGIKAVLVTDVLQAILMFAALLSIIVIAAINVGGLGQIWEIAKQGQRIEFDNISVDPTERYTWWSVFIGGLCIFLTHHAVNQVQVQRLLTVKDMNAAKKAVWFSCPILIVFAIIMCFSGLAIYSKYYNCDPILQKRITSPDMFMPLYVMETMGSVPGLPGLFIAGIFSAGLSSISAIINSLTAMTLEDYMKPAYRKIMGYELAPKKSTLIAKILAFTFGIGTIALAFLAQLLGGLLQAGLVIVGIVGGPLLGLFTLGMSTESATEGGAIIGTLTAFVFLFWISFGQPRPIPTKLPTTIENCDIKGFANATMSVLQNVTNSSKRTGDNSYFYLYRISYMWYSPLGFLITFVLGLSISNLFHLFFKTEIDNLDPHLFFPVITRRIIKRQRKNIEMNVENDTKLETKYSFSNADLKTDHAKDGSLHSIKDTIAI